MELSLDESARMPASQAAPESWAEIDKDVVKEIVRQAELQLQQQALTAQFLDQRATSMAAFTNGGAVAIFVFIISELSKGDDLNQPVLWASIPIALAWFVSALCALQALKPGTWASAGTWPHQWYPLLRQGPAKEQEFLGAEQNSLRKIANITVDAMTRLFAT